MEGWTCGGMGSRSYVHTSIRPYVHTSIRPYVHTSIRPYVHTSIRPYVHTSIPPVPPLTPRYSPHIISSQPNRPWSFAAYCRHVKQSAKKRYEPGGLQPSGLRRFGHRHFDGI